MVALLAGLAIFPSVFHFASVEGVNVDTLELNGIMLMFETLPKVFESIGVVGKIIEFFFFAMVSIAAITSVISIMEVASQFVIQKFKISRKIATAIIAGITFAVSIPVSFSLGFALNGESGMTLFGLDWLSFLDTVTNAVLMPVCAFLSCMTVGWFIGPKQMFGEISASGSLFGKADGVMHIMIKFVAPILIALIEVFGVIDIVFPGGKFSANGLGIILVSYILVGILIGIYFLLLKNTETGTNADERA
jgi:NSS family neurotransmitter:Na+ symporter